MFSDKLIVLTTAPSFFRVAVIDLIFVLVGFSREYLATTSLSNTFLSVLTNFSIGFSVNGTKFLIASFNFSVAAFTLLWVVASAAFTVFATARASSKDFHVWVVYSSLRLLLAVLIAVCNAVLSTARALIASWRALVAASISLCLGSGVVWLLISLALISAFLNSFQVVGL